MTMDMGEPLAAVVVPAVNKDYQYFYNVKGEVEAIIFPIRETAELDKLFGALAKAQGDIEGASKDQVNQGIRGGPKKYADLASVWEVARDPLAKNDLSIIQLPLGQILVDLPEGAGDEDDFGQKKKDRSYGKAWFYLVRTRLCHGSGQWIESTIGMPVLKHNAHGFGSAMTYCRRYALASMVGIYQDDDDGNGANGKEPQGNQPQGGQAPRERKEKAPQGTPERDIGKEILAAAKIIGLTKVTDLKPIFQEIAGKPDLNGHSSEVYEKVLQHLVDRKAQMDKELEEVTNEALGEKKEDAD